MIKMRKFMLILSLFLFVFSVDKIVHANEEVVGLSASEVSISQGSSGYVSFTLNGAVDITVLSFAIFYDADFLDVGYVKDDLMNDKINVDFEDDGVINVTFDEEEAITSEGVLLEVFFNVDVDADVGLYPISIVMNETKDSNNEDVHIVPLGGHITVEQEEILIEEITLYSRVSEREQDNKNILTYEVYADSFKGLSTFEGQVMFDADYFTLFDASFGDGLIGDMSHGKILFDDGLVSFDYASGGAIDDDQVLLSVELEVISLEAFQSSISFEASRLIDHDLREINANKTSKEVMMDDGVFVSDHPDMFLTSYGGTEKQSFEIYVKIEENSMLASGDFILHYNQEMLEVVRVQVGYNVTSKGGVLFFEDDVYDGNIHFSYFHDTSLDEADTLLIVTFKASDGTALTSSDLMIEGSNTYNHDYADLDLDYVAGTVEFFTAFLVKFVDYDNTVLSSAMYEENEAIVAPDVDERNNTVFKEWDKTFDLATQNSTIKAIYELVETQIIMDDMTVVYDGNEHVLNVQGLPTGASVTYDVNAYTNVGEYTVYADVYLDGRYQFTKEATLTITPRPITVTVGEHERVYNSVGSIAYTVNGKIAGDDLDIEVSTTDGYDVGVHALTAVVHNENYVASVIDGTLIITKATYDMSGVTFTPITYTKGGNTYFVYVSGDLPEGVNVTYINNGKSEVGTYTVTAEFYGDYDNYEQIDGMSTTLTIDSPTILGPTFINETVVYDGTLHSIDVINLPSGASVVYTGGNSFRYAGEYTVQATISKDGYEDMVLVATLTIEKASYNLSDVVFEDASFEFDGESYSLEIGGTLPADVEVTYVNNGQRSVGEYEVLAHFTSDDPNYQAMPSMTAVLSILDNPYVDITFEDKVVVYDGEIHMLDLVNVPLDASVSYDINNEFIDAGEYTVTAQIMMDGYNPYQMTATLTIEKEVLVIQADDKVSVYGEDLLDLTYTIEGTIYNEEVLIGIYKEGSNFAGVYVINISATHQNYDITLINGTYTIDKATYDMSGIDLNHSRVTYDGTIHHIDIEGTLPIGVTVDYVNNNQESIGIYTVTASFTIGDENYYQIPPMQARLIIEPAQMVDLVFDSVTVPYDGEVHSIEVDNLPDGATVFYTPSNTYSASGVYPIQAIVSLDGYVSQVLEATLTIEGMDVLIDDLLFTDESYTYDSELKTLLLDGVLPEGVIGVDYLNHRRTESGEQVVLLKVYVEDAYNPVDNLVALLTIEKANIEGITFTGGDFVYDGTEKAFVLSGTLAQYGHTLDVEYDANLTYINAGTYTVSVTLSHPNYQTLVLEETMFIEKATRTIDASEFSVTVFDHEIQFLRETLLDLVYFSVDDGPFVYGTTAASLEENTWYTVDIYLGETLNYKQSNTISFERKTYLSGSTVEDMISSVGEVTLSTRNNIIEIIEQIDLLMPSEQEVQTLALSQVIGEYNALVESYQYEYMLAGDTVEKIFPLALFRPDYQLATMEDIKRRDLI